MDATFRSPSFLQCSSEGGKAQLARLWAHQERRKTGGILSGEVHVCVNQVLSRFGGYYIIRGVGICRCYESSSVALRVLQSSNSPATSTLAIATTIIARVRPSGI